MLKKQNLENVLYVLKELFHYLDQQNVQFALLVAFQKKVHYFVLYVLQVPTLKVQNLENALYALQEPFHCKEQ